jgi:hypothetical protein
LLNLNRGVEWGMANHWKAVLKERAKEDSQFKEEETHPLATRARQLNGGLPDIFNKS